MRVRRGLLLACAAAALFAPAPAQAKPLAINDLRDTRYCEIFTVDLQPSPVATIWNTLGLGQCPAAWWASLETGAIATEYGSDLAALNGPRAFIMDRAVANQHGPVHTFSGERLRNVATIDLSSLPGLQLPAYTEFEITRDTNWVFERGRRVFELLAPNGRVYTMQSYAQIVDPDLTYSQLRNLGPRLGLPEGWRYRTRRPHRKLALRARGSAVIVQDALKNTYQRRPARRP